LGGRSVSASADDGDPLTERPLPVQLKPLALLAYRRHRCGSY
jgi:hypothetical protein